MENKDIDSIFKENIDDYENQSSAKSWDIDQQWQQFEALQKNKSKKRTLAIVVSIAAVFTVFLFSVGLLKFQKQDIIQSYHTSEKEVKKIELPDGSEVWLNRNTKLVYNETSISNTCEIRMEGEAWFNFRQSESKNYVIITVNARIMVQQAEFNVKALANADNVIITVADGSLSVSDIESNGLSMLVENGNSCKVHKSNKLVSSDKVTDTNYLAWKTGKIVFNETPLYTVVAVLSEVYNTPIEINNDALGECSVTSTMDYKSLDEVMNMLNKLLNTEIIKIDNRYVLAGRGCL